MTDCTTCRHFGNTPEARHDNHTFGECKHDEGPKNARTTGMHLPISTNSRLVSDGMSCDNYEPWKGAA